MMRSCPAEVRISISTNKPLASEAIAWRCVSIGPIDGNDGANSAGLRIDCIADTGKACRPFDCIIAGSQTNDRFKADRLNHLRQGWAVMMLGKPLGALAWTMARNWR